MIPSRRTWVDGMARQPRLVLGVAAVGRAHELESVGKDEGVEPQHFCGTVV